jgi:hypothetical protein
MTASVTRKLAQQSRRAFGRFIRAAGASSYFGSVDVDAEQKREGPQEGQVIRID